MDVKPGARSRCSADPSGLSLPSPAPRQSAGSHSGRGWTWSWKSLRLDLGKQRGQGWTPKVGTGGGQVGSKGLGLEKVVTMENAQSPVPGKGHRVKAGGGHSSQARTGGPEAAVGPPVWSGPGPGGAEVGW